MKTAFLQIFVLIINEKLAASHPALQTYSDLSNPPMPRLDKLSIGDAYHSDSKAAINDDMHDQPREFGQSVAAPRPQPKAFDLHAFQSITEPSRFFTVGRVFKVPWIEPAGANFNEDDLFHSTLPNGLKVFTKVRRFVVVKEMQGCSLCLSLVTYKRQGTTKSSVCSKNYAAVYDVRKKPYYLTGESLQKEPFPIIIETSNEHVDPTSRLNFGRVYTIEHNLRVLKVGRIPTKHLSLLQTYFRGTTIGMCVNEEECPGCVTHLEGGVSMQPALSKTQADRLESVDDMNNSEYSPPLANPSVPNAETAGGSKSTLFVPELDRRKYLNLLTL